MSCPGACGGCTRRWESCSQAHCSTCHAHFGGVRSFDLHLPRPSEGKPKPCIPPGEVTNRSGTKLLFLGPDGVWRQDSERQTLERMQTVRSGRSGGKSPDEAR